MPTFQTEYLHRDPWEGSHTSYEFVVKFSAIEERGPGLAGKVLIDDLEVVYLLEAVAWFGEIKGGRISLSNDIDGNFETAVLESFREQLRKSKALQELVKAKCAESYLDDCELRAAG